MTEKFQARLKTSHLCACVRSYSTGSVVCLRLFLPRARLCTARITTTSAAAVTAAVVEKIVHPRSRFTGCCLLLSFAACAAARNQKIIPVIYKSITKPNILSGINPCDRTRVLDDEWFWRNLIRSLHGGSGGGKSRSESRHL